MKPYKLINWLPSQLQIPSFDERKSFQPVAFIDHESATALLPSVIVFNCLIRYKSFRLSIRIATRRSACDGAKVITHISGKHKANGPGAQTDDPDEIIKLRKNEMTAKSIRRMSSRIDGMSLIGNWLEFAAPKTWICGRPLCCPCQCCSDCDGKVLQLFLLLPFRERRISFN